MSSNSLGVKRNHNGKLPPKEPITNRFDFRTFKSRGQTFANRPSFSCYCTFKIKRDRYIDIPSGELIDGGDGNEDDGGNEISVAPSKKGSISYLTLQLGMTALAPILVASIPIAILKHLLH